MLPNKHRKLLSPLAAAHAFRAGSGFAGWLLLVASSCLPDGSPASPDAADAPCALSAATPDLTGYRSSRVTTSYPAALPGRTGWFQSGQSADLMLSGFGFDRTGGPLLFNHPRSIASDGTHFLLSDGNNNRVLVWRTLPTGNTAPDFVLGQPDFLHNTPGTGLHQMNWPGQVAVTIGGPLVIADTYNDRLLVWTRFPTASGQPADYALQHGQLKWPWGAWTDGTRLAATSTQGGRLLLWKTFPSGNASPDLILSGWGIGTPRTIVSDGHSFIMGDHNANLTNSGNWFWLEIPASASQGPDFFTSDPSDPHAGWMQGTFTSDGRLFLMGSRALNIWNAVPRSAATKPDLIVTGHRFQGGDGNGVVIAGGRTYVLEYNGNRIAVYHGIPAVASAAPDFAIGAPDLETNTLRTNFVVTNAVPAVAGGRLFVASDFEARMMMWDALPDAVGAHPDWVYELPFGPWAIAATDSSLALAGNQTVAVWTRLPSGGSLPDVVYRGTMGAVTLQDARGVAIDERYFYVADKLAGKVYAWRGRPSSGCAPAVTLELQGPTRLSSDGTWLAVTQTEAHTVRLYRVATLASQPVAAVVGGPGTFNLPQSGVVS
ncbi:MAG: hypothetical protein HY700_16335, partial [Gemmatimonadetes bacterium]|nr:hypothetical protein [Gemmatimonadota bacterium]